VLFDLPQVLSLGDGGRVGQVSALDGGAFGLRYQLGQHGLGTGTSLALGVKPFRSPPAGH